MTTTEHPFGFSKVYVIESLKPKETPTGRLLCDTVLGPLVVSLGLKAEYQSISTSRELVVNLARIEKECTEQNEGPIIHIEAHGTEEYLRLSSNEQVTWEELRAQLTAINAACRMNLLVVMAMCKGAYLGKILRPGRPAPVWGIVGPLEDIHYQVLLDGMKALYTLVLSSMGLFDAVKEMNVHAAANATKYEFLPAELLFWRALRSYVAENDPDTIRQRASELVARAVREQGVTIDQTPILRQRFIEQLSDQRALFDQYRKPFLMLDRFPENQPRFPLSFDDFQGRA
jgi:hypothetical protein